MQRLQLVMAMRRHEMFLEFIQMAHAQEMEMHARQQQEEEEAMAIAIARSLGGNIETPSGSGSTTAAAPRGPSAALIEEMLPSMPFSEAKGFLVANADGSDGDGTGHECSICIAEMGTEDKVRVLPCVHCFHASCIDSWFRKTTAAPSCPTCKTPVALG